MAGTDQHQIRQHRHTKGFSLNFSQFVARQYWRKHWATLPIVIELMAWKTARF